MELFERMYDVGNVFNDMNSAHFPKRAVAERKREMIQVRNYIGAGVDVAIQSNRARILVLTAADIQNWKLARSSLLAS